MKSNVKSSIYVVLTTLGALGALLSGVIIYYIHGMYVGSAIMITFLSVLLILGLFYAPLSVSIDLDYIKVRSAFRTLRIPIDSIDSIELFQPTMGALRICASAGFMGHWGLYREGDVGNYIAFYGKSSDCFFIRLKNGDKYVVGCENPDQMVRTITDRMTRTNQ